MDIDARRIETSRACNLRAKSVPIVGTEISARDANKQLLPDSEEEAWPYSYTNSLPVI